MEINFSNLISSVELEQIIPDNGPFGAMGAFFTQLSIRLDKPLILIIDKIDALVVDTLLSVLRQIRAGYDNRPLYFPYQSFSTVFLMFVTTGPL
jgi:hypothetical protein